MMAVLFIILQAEAQEARPVIGLNTLQTRGIGTEEVRFIESLIQSYVSNAGDVVYYFHDNPGIRNYFGNFLPDGISYSMVKTPDYILSGSIVKERSGRVFTLEILNTHTEETSRFSTVHRTSGDLAVKTRAIVENAFRELLTTERNYNAETQETITESIITGTWRGEPGIEIIRLQKEGQGVAFFSSGVHMNLSYTIENNVLIVTQTSPNTELYYYPLPQGIARQLSARAAPMRWELLLHSGGSRLKGSKISTEVRVDGNASEEYRYETRNSLWVRVSR